MTESLKEWCELNKLKITESGEIITIKDVGKFLYLKSTDGNIIDEDFGFIVSDEEFELLESDSVDFILFEFGGRFYYSKKNKDKNKYNEILFKPEFNDFKNLGDCEEEHVIDFFHLGVHTEYELLNGSSSPEDWAKKAKFLKSKCLGVCDKNTLASALSFQTACEKNEIKPIIGETICVAKNYSKEKDIQEIFELKLFVMNYTGWKNLLLINKSINVDYNGFIPEDLLYELGKGICCVIPKESDFNYSISDKKYCKKLIKLYKKNFDKVFYQLDTVEFVSDKIFKEHLNNIDDYLCNFASVLEPFLINDSYYIDKEENVLKPMLNKIGGFVNPESKDQYFKSFKDTIDSYSDWIDTVDVLFENIIRGIENVKEFSESIEFRINTGERKLPKFEVKNTDSFFFEKLEDGINERLSHLPPKKLKKYLDRIEVECSVIVPNGLTDYFMILWDIINWCKNNDINVGTGRGSVCGSLIAYCLHITDVDPLKYGLMFERFLNETRVSGERAKSADSMPDIDVDFPTEHRDEVKNYIKEKYGYDYTCSIGTFNRMQLRMCIKDIGKEKGLSFDYTNKLTKNIENQINYSWGDLFEYASQSKILFDFVQKYPEIVHLIRFALLQPKAESVHPSAVVIVPKRTNDDSRNIDIWEWLPVKQIGGILVSEWEGKYIDKSGFLKEDILGLNQLDKFKFITNLIKKDYKKDINLNKIPLDDENVFKFFKRGWNEDVFQFGTSGFINYCKQVKPDKLENLTAMTALFRPGPMSMNAHTDFADIKNGKKKPVYDFGMEKITSETFGLYVYQEQIMKAVVVGGLTEVESDVLRTTIKKKDIKTLSSFGEKFKKGYISLLKKNNIKNPKEYADKVWKKLLAFSGYGFNKSHAAAYTIMSYWSQWFKVNYPLEFWTTTLQFSKESEIPYRLSEMKKSNSLLEVRPPDVNFSETVFTCDEKENRIFFSLTKIKQIANKASEAISQTRKEGGRFFSFDEFVSRVPTKCNKTAIKNLIISGSFDLIEEIENPRDRKKLLKKYLVEVKNDEKSFEDFNTPDSNSNSFWITKQRELTGYGEVDYETIVKDSITNKRIAKLFVTELDFIKTKSNKEVTIAGKVIFYKETEIKTGTMCSLNVDCNNTIIPVILWPDAYEKTERGEILKDCIVAVNGIVGNDKYRNIKTLYSSSKTRLYIVTDKK